MAKDRSAIYAQLSKEDKIILKACAKSFEFFVTKLLGALPSKQQLEVIRAVDDGATHIAIKSGHGVGKTTLMSWFIIWFGLFREDTKIPMTAPTASQLYDILIPEISKWRQKLPSFLKDEVEVQKEKVVFANGNFAVARTARPDKPEALQGFHGTHIAFILEEASGIPEKIFEVAEGALTSENSFALMAGNPTRTSGFFYQTFAHPDGVWKLFTFNAEESENVSRKAILNFQKKYGKDSDVYRVRVKGEFPRGSSNAVFPVDLIESAIYRDVWDTTGIEIWGLDVADYGDDRSVLARRHGKNLYQYDYVRNYDADDLVRWLVREYKKAKVKPKIIFVDTIGSGASIPSMAEKAGLKIVYGAKASNKAVNHEEYQNARAEWFFKMREALEDEGKLINDDELIGELGAITYHINDQTGKLQIEAKDKIRKSLGRSPDIADAFALTFADENLVLYELEKGDDEPDFDEEQNLIYSYGGGLW